MKKVIYGISAIVVAVAGVAASKAPSKTSSYYFAYTALGTHLNYITTPPPTLNISGCSGTSNPNCSQSATSYTKVGTLYEPKSGTLGTIFKSQN